MLPCPLTSPLFPYTTLFRSIGIAIATRIVDPWGAWKTSVLFTVLLLAGVTGWALSAGIYPLMAASVAVWGLGFASTNSRSEEHTSELQSRGHLVCRLLLEKK